MAPWACGFVAFVMIATVFYVSIERPRYASREMASPAAFAEGVPTINTANMQPVVAKIIQQARRDVVARPRSAEAWGSLAAACEVHQLIEEATALYRRAHDLAPNDFRWIYFLAIALDLLGTNADEPMELFRRAALLKPGWAPLYVRLGDAFAKRGKLEAARDAYAEAISFEPSFAIAHYGLGQALMKLGETSTAVDHLETAALGAPADGPVFGALAQAYMRLGDRDRAVAAAEKARHLKPVLVLSDPIRRGVYALGVSSRICYRRAAAILQAGGAAEAVPYLKTLEQVQPRDPTVHIWSAFAHLRMARRSAALDSLAKALRLRKELVTTDETIAPIPTARNQLDASIQKFWREYLDAVTAAEDRREFHLAISRFGATMEELPLSAETRLAWGTALLKNGNIREAAERFEEAARLAPHSVKAHYSLGLIFEELGDTARAQRYFERATELDASDAATRRRLAIRGNGG